MVYTARQFKVIGDVENDVPITHRLWAHNLGDALDQARKLPRAPGVNLIKVSDELLVRKRLRLDFDAYSHRWA